MSKMHTTSKMLDVLHNLGYSNDDLLSESRALGLSLTAIDFETAKDPRAASDLKLSLALLRLYNSLI